MFLFLDTENSGLSRDFSQIFEIAIIATDADLNLMSSLHERCGNVPWVVPTPGAMLITGITPDQLKKEKLSHYEMMCKTNAYINAQNWPVIFAGYNIHGYDQPVISQNLHQTLHDPFVMSGRRHWGAEANTVFDVFELVKATMIHAPDVLTLKTPSATGKPSLSLLNVALQNGVSLSAEDAHGALADTKATIDVAAKIKNEAPEIWAQMLAMCNRSTVDKFMKDNPVFAYSQYTYGQAHTVIGTLLTKPNGSKTDALIWDLNVDPALYASTSDDDLVDVLKTWGKDRFATPLQSLRTHKQPILMPLDKAKAHMPKTLSQADVDARLKWIKDNPDFVKRVNAAAKKAKKPFKTGVEPEQQIFNFPPRHISEDLKAWKQQFHAADYPQKLELLSVFKKDFSKEIKEKPALKRFLTFAQRIVYAGGAEHMNPETVKKIDQAVHARVTKEGEDIPYVTIAKARAELAVIEQERAEGKETWAHVTDSQIRSLKLYYTKLEKMKNSANDEVSQSGTKKKRVVKKASGPKR